MKVANCVALARQSCGQPVNIQTTGVNAQVIIARAKMIVVVRNVPPGLRQNFILGSNLVEPVSGPLSTRSSQRLAPRTVGLPKRTAVVVETVFVQDRTTAHVTRLGPSQPSL
jgi:hypothetical protein